MRRAVQLLYLASICSVLSACDKVAPNDTPIRRSPAAETNGGIIQGAVAPIDTTLTLGDWLIKNPTDSVSIGFTSDPGQESICGVAIAKGDLSGHSLTRLALFNASPPADEKLPDDTTDLAAKICRLKTVKFQSDEMDLTTAARVSDSLAVAIEERVGHRAPVADVPEAQRPQWLSVKAWKTPATTVILAIVPADNSSRGKIVLNVLAPGGFMNDNSYWTTRYLKTVRPIGDNLEQDLVDADSAIAWARLPAVASDLQRMLAAVRLRRNDSSARRQAEDDSALIRAMRIIKDSAPHLDPARRSAALLAGDLVRYAAIPYPPETTDNPDRRLFHSAQSIVLGSDVDQSQSGYWFNRAWLWDAFEADSLGRAGHLAFVRMLKRGFNQSAECADGTDFYYTMIQRGEADLRRGDKDPLVHFYVGVAYMSIFDYSHFVPEDTALYHNPSKEEGEAARVHAINHLRAALGGLTDKQMRSDTWAMVADLLLHKSMLPPFQCAGEDD